MASRSHFTLRGVVRGSAYGAHDLRSRGQKTVLPCSMRSFDGKGPGRSGRR